MQFRPLLIVCALSLPRFGVVAFAEDAAAAGNEFFESKIRPVLVERCYSCHSAESEKLKGGLRVDSREGMLKGGDNGPIVVPGDPEKSSLIRAIRFKDDDLLMPPKKKLEAQQIADFEAWVKMGAPDPRTAPAKAIKPLVDVNAAKSFWSFQPVKLPAIPNVKTANADANAIDRFLLAQIEAKNLTPAKAADKRTLIRRATYDLTGLPPTPEEIRAFEIDTTPSAFAKVVDRLLVSPAYGERWGRHWLDVVRYADTAGETADYPVPLAYRYRNYVIDAFNQDKPYDQFLREQIAGDILAANGPAEKYAERVVATGYLAISRRFGFDSENYMHLTIEDTLDTLGKSVLGLSIGCSRCHDHKFDPILMTDYYALYGIFSSTRYAFPGSEEKKRSRDMVPMMPPQEIDRLMKPLQEALAPLDAEVKKLEAEKAALEKDGKDRAAKPAAPLASGAIDNGGKQDFSKGTGAAALEKIDVKSGDMIQVTVLPKANHGADSTTVELEIAEILEADGPARTWNLAGDVVPDLLDGGKGNPHRDGRGNEGVWYFFDSLNGGKMLSKGVDSSAKTMGLSSWQNSEDTPAVFVNANDVELKVSTVTLPPRSIAIHPSPKGGVTVAWQSPLDGTVRISGRVADADATGGDGIAWEIHHGAGIGKYLLALQKVSGTVAEARKRRDEAAAKLPVVEKAYAVVEGTPKNAQLQRRGEPKNLGEEVPRHFLQILGGQALPADCKGSGRLQLAEWLTDPANPLTARVMANRIWQHHFGRGIVQTPNDFGKRGAAPTHPELLDFLAAKFVESGWSMKQMHRLMMLSQAYQRSSTDDDRNAAIDHDNLLVWRYNARRMDAEEIRDTILVLSNTLDRSPAGQHPFPAEETWGYTQHNPFTAVYDNDRRGIYLMTQRIKRHPYLALFDGPDPNSSTPQRRLTTVPTQALFFLNDPFVFAKATKLAGRILASGKDTAARLDFAYRNVFGRAPESNEREDAQKFFEAYRAELLKAKTPPEKAEENAWAAYVRVLFSDNEFVHLD
jgi:hypothetical protein